MGRVYHEVRGYIDHVTHETCTTIRILNSVPLIPEEITPRLAKENPKWMVVIGVKARPYTENGYSIDFRGHAFWIFWSENKYEIKDD